ncbi:conserved hypothetical protein [Coccidioides posadasii str. Silveira]|uniref:Uncharacterized protein n=1 Tax=Coccidioides posadasii (strain RMSCC 757 / Silveira) TaxID=443226 RepID=E9DJC5_COCPS|nr:conserved hypothetical protein [Coccidioides posadasii str. Silveira]
MSDTLLITPQRPGCIAIGQAGEICKIDESYIVKYPKTFPGNSAYNNLRLHFMAVERQIYERLGPHEDSCLSWAPRRFWSNKLAYARQGDLEAYIPAHDVPSRQFRDMDPITSGCSLSYLFLQSTAPGCQAEQHSCRQ